MIEIVEKIATLLGVGRYGRKRKRRKSRMVVVRRETDTVTISDEARRLAVDETCNRASGGGRDVSPKEER